MSTPQLTPTPAELAAILAKHKAWRNEKPEGERADLRGADLSNANLSNADLSNANLYGAVFSIRVVTFGPLGTQDQMTLFLPYADLVRSGCWKGTLVEFRAKVVELFAKGSERRAMFDAGIGLFEAAAAAEAADPRPDVVPTADSNDQAAEPS